MFLFIAENLEKRYQQCLKMLKTKIVNSWQSRWKSSSSIKESPVKCLIRIRVKETYIMFMAVSLRFLPKILSQSHPLHQRKLFNYLYDSFLSHSLNHEKLKKCTFRVFVFLFVGHFVFYLHHYYFYSRQWTPIALADYLPDFIWRFSLSRNTKTRFQEKGLVLVLWFHPWYFSSTSRLLEPGNEKKKGIQNLARLIQILARIFQDGLNCKQNRRTIYFFVGFLARFCKILNLSITRSEKICTKPAISIEK